MQAETKDFWIAKLDYFSLKIKKPLNFGVKDAVWFFSRTRQDFLC